MTTDLPAGPDLDHAVSEAMYGGMALVPRYSTTFGPWTQEMLDWLRKRDIAEIKLYKRGDVWASSGFSSTSTFVDVDADSIPLALARLVVAVAARRSET